MFNVRPGPDVELKSKVKVSSEVFESKEPIIKKLKECIVGYLKTDKRRKEAEITTILESEKYLKLKFGFWTPGDDGDKRARFLYDKLNQYKTSGEELCREVFALASSDAEPPVGLGDSDKLRGRVYDVLCNELKIDSTKDWVALAAASHGYVISVTQIKQEHLAKKLKVRIGAEYN